MEIIIDISDLDYFDIKHGYADNYQRERLVESVKCSIAIPKGHGRLIDADAFERRCMFDSDIEDMQDVIYALRDYKTIIEADKEVENEGNR